MLFPRSYFFFLLFSCFTYSSAFAEFEMRTYRFDEYWKIAKLTENQKKDFDRVKFEHIHTIDSWSEISERLEDFCKTQETKKGERFERLDGYNKWEFSCSKGQIDSSQPEKFSSNSSLVDGGLSVKIRQLIKQAYSEYSKFANNNIMINNIKVNLDQVELRKGKRTITLLSEWHFAEGEEAIKAKAVADRLLEAAEAGDFIYLEDAEASMCGGGGTPDSPDWIKSRMKTFGSKEREGGGIVFQLWKLLSDSSPQVFLLEPNSDKCPEEIAVSAYEREILIPITSAYGRVNVALMNAKLDPMRDTTSLQRERDIAFKAFEKARAEAMKLLFIGATARSTVMAQTLEKYVPNERYAFAIMGGAHLSEVLDLLTELGWSVVESSESR